MRCKELSSAADIASAAGLSVRAHEGLRARLPFLPVRSEDDLRPRIEWMTRKGVVLGLFDAARLQAFLGAFPIENFRNAGAGSVGPDWCHGASRGIGLGEACRLLYRELAPRLLSLGCPIHAFSFYDSESEAVDAMELTGFGCVVLDAARPTAELLEELPSVSGGVAVRRAGPEDATELARLDAGLAAHIAASPVSMPNTRGRGAAEWAAWLSEADHIGLLALRGGRIVGFIKAQEPQFDVSYAVHDASTLAINGMYVEAASRRTGVGCRLLGALARGAAAAGKTVVSVDFETTNLEAYGFWTRWFKPVTWSLERRV